MPAFGYSTADNNVPDNIRKNVAGKEESNAPVAVFAGAYDIGSNIEQVIRRSRDFLFQ